MQSTQFIFISVLILGYILYYKYTTLHALKIIYQYYYFSIFLGNNLTDKAHRKDVRV